MPSKLKKRTVALAARRVPGLRMLPAAALVALAEVAVVAREHVALLTPDERRRMVVLLAHGRGRPGNLSRRERDELADLVAKLEPRMMAGEAVERISPVPLPRRLVYGRGRRPQTR